MKAATAQANEHPLQLQEDRRREHEQNRARNLRDRLIQWAETVPLRMEGTALEDAAQEDLPILQQMAVEHYNRHYSRANERLRTRPEVVDQKTMDRWCVNFLRHQYTLYDRRTTRIGNHQEPRARREAMLVIRSRTYQIIMEAWPQLADECRNQMNQRDE